jgi:redox-sensitive bicupin YhaK (pirin superfamily)
MTAGRGIAHSEESPEDHDPALHGVQLWLALPGPERDVAPAFGHHAELPSAGLAGFEVTVFAGSLAGVRSPATVFSAVTGAELHAARAASGRISLDPAHEHMVFTVTGQATADGTGLSPGPLLHLGTGRDGVSLAAPAGSTLLLPGGEPGYHGRLRPAPPVDRMSLLRR